MLVKLLTFKNEQKYHLVLNKFQSRHFFYYTQLPLLVVTSFFGACSKKESIEYKIHQAQSLQKEVALSSSVLNEAKNIDIPVPIGFSLLTQVSTDYLDHVVYGGSLAVDQVKLFFSHEMERLGWSIVEFIAPDEVLFFCKKSSKTCAIAIRSSKHKSFKTELSIFVRPLTNKNLSYE